MKRNIYHISILLLFVLIAISCREDELNENGLLRLNIGVKDKVTTVTRNLSDETLKALKENCKIRIYSCLLYTSHTCLYRLIQQFEIRKYQVDRIILLQIKRRGKE